MFIQLSSLWVKVLRFQGGHCFCSQPLSAIMEKEKYIGLIGIGLFICLILQGISFLFFKIIEAFLLVSTINPILLYGISKYLSLAFTILIFLIIIKRLKRYDFENIRILKKVFLLSILGYAVTQILEFALPFITNIYKSPDYDALWENYHFILEHKYFFKELLIDTPVWLIKDILIVIIFYRSVSSPTETK